MYIVTLLKTNYMKYALSEPSLTTLLIDNTKNFAIINRWLTIVILKFKSYTNKLEIKSMEQVDNGS